MAEHLGNGTVAGPKERKGIRQPVEPFIFPDRSTEEDDIGSLWYTTGRG